MLIFFYGDDAYSSQKNAQKIERDFVNSQGSDLNVSKLDGAKISFSSFVSVANALPFLGDKRLIIIKNLLTENQDIETKKKIAEAISENPPSNTILFLETSLPDRRETLFKRLQALANTKEFGAVSESILPRLIQKRVISADLQIAGPAVSKLILYVGADLSRLDNEIEKLILFAKASRKGEIEIDDIEKLVTPNIALKVFDLTDAIAAKNAKKAISICLGLQKSGEESGMILNMIIYQFRNMLIIDEANRLQKGDLAKETGVHPYVIKKTLAVLRNFQEGEIEDKYIQLRDFDWKIKNGAIDLETALSLLVVDFCKR